MHIIIYTKTGCPWCIDALAFLRERGLAFEERNVTSNPAYFEEMKTLSGQTKAPTLVIDGHVIADTDREQIAAHLEKVVSM